MHIAYSAINTINNNPPQSITVCEDRQENELMLRFQAYQTACNKYSREIAAIQKYTPGWLPKFR